MTTLKDAAIEMNSEENRIRSKYRVWFVDGGFSFNTGWVVQKKCLWWWSNITTPKNRETKGNIDCLKEELIREEINTLKLCASRDEKDG